MTKDVGHALSKHPCNFIDAPVSGGVPGAINGTLTFMVGGKDESLCDEAKKYTQFMGFQYLIIGKNTVYCGPIGQGQVAKGLS